MQISAFNLFVFFVFASIHGALSVQYNVSESKVIAKKHLPDKHERSGIAVQKAPPDLQFGLAFTVPFVSLSTDKLLNKYQGRGSYDKDVSSLLKLNVGGLVIAAIVGIAALLFVPSIIPGGLPSLIPPGFFPGVLDSMYNNHHHHQYPPHDYNNQEYNSGHWRDSRQAKFENGTSLLEKAETFLRPYENCTKLQMCLRGREKFKKHMTTVDHVLEALQGFRNYTAHAPVFHYLHEAYDHGSNGGDCSKFKC